MYPTRSNWQMILSQTKILNIFSGSLEISFVIEILSSYSNRYTYEYIPHRDLWLSRLYFEISNSSEKKKCLTINIKYINNVGTSKFRTGVKNDKEQVCYFNYNKKDRAFNRFLAIRKPTSTSEIIFFIVSLIGKSKKFEDNYYKISNELREFDNDFSLNRKFQSLVKQTLDSQKQTVVEVLKEKETVKNNEESAKNPDLFQDNNVIRKKTSIKPYTITRIKSRNFLLNISYVGISKEDFYN